MGWAQPYKFIHWLTQLRDCNCWVGLLHVYTLYVIDTHTPLIGWADTSFQYSLAYINCVLWALLNFGSEDDASTFNRGLVNFNTYILINFYLLLRMRLMVAHSFMYFLLYFLPFLTPRKKKKNHKIITFLSFYCPGWLKFWE